MHSVASIQHIFIMYICHENYHIVLCILYFAYIGARADIKDDSGNTPLQWAEEELTEQSDPERKQRHEKVHEDTHTCAIYTWELPMVAVRNIIRILVV